MASMSRLSGLWRREWRLAVQLRNEYMQPPIFFVLSVCLFPLGIGPAPELLQQIAPAIIWIAALLACLLGLDTLFRRDFADGTLEQLLLHAQPPFFAILLKVGVHWLATAGPLLIFTPMLAHIVDLPMVVLPSLLLGLFLGTPILSLLGAVGAALAVTLRSGSMLLGLLLLPLFAPVLIVGAIAADNAAHSLDPAAALLWLGVLLVLAITLAPFAITAALRAALFS